MTDHPDIVERLTSTSVVISNLPELPGYNGSVLTIDDEEAVRCAADIDAGAAEITRLRAEAEALRKALEDERHQCAMTVWMTLQEATADDADDMGLDGWMREAERRIHARAAIAATKEQQA